MADGTIKQYQVTASSGAAQKLFPAEPAAISRIMQNTSTSVDIFFGGADVLASTGMVLKAGTMIALDWKGEIWVITSSSTADVRGGTQLY